ncbi:MAG: hypothetical protein IRZ04_00415 [Rhodospirillales bacterium]|nr:hypothetical protein [Rhodospirillales bacterium]
MGLLQSHGRRRGTLRQDGVIVGSLEEARRALAAGATRLESYPAAGLSAGPGWFQAIVEALEAEFPGRPFEAVLDCGDAPGAALAALRRGVRRVRLCGDPAAIGRVAEIAARLGAVVETNETAG